MRLFALRVLSCVCLVTAAAFAQTEPWTKAEVVQPEQLVARLKDLSRPRPMLIDVAFAVLYRSRHIPDAVYAGPGSKPEGLELLRTAVGAEAKNREIIIYCGCCPMVKCPNVRPAFRLLRDLGFQQIKVVYIPTNLAKDWIDKGYPIVRPGTQ